MLGRGTLVATKDGPPPLVQQALTAYASLSCFIQTQMPLFTISSKELTPNRFNHFILNVTASREPW